MTNTTDIQAHDHGCCDGLWTHSLDCANSTDPWAELANEQDEVERLAGELERKGRRIAVLERTARELEICFCDFDDEASPECATCDPKEDVDAE